MAGGHGGYREGAGRKPADYVPSQSKVDFEAERAAHEKVKREQREFKLAQERGEYVSREAVRQATATALAVLTQSVRSIPDNLEREMSLQPDVVGKMAEQLDAALGELSKALKAMTNDR